MFTQQAFGYDSLQTGLLFTAIGVIIAVNQTLLLNKVWTKYFNNQQLEMIMFVITMVGLLLAASQNILLFYASLPFIGTSQAVYRVVVANEAISTVDPTMKGEIMGTIASVMTAAMVISPIAGGVLFEWNISLPFFAALLFILSAVTISVKK